jgi:Nif-specific regulatory protein
MANIRLPTPKPRHKEQLAEQEALLIRESIKLLARSFEPAKAIREMLHLASELLGLNRGRVILPDTAKGDLAIRYAYGLTAEEVKRGRYAVREGISGQVMQSGETIIVQDIDAEPKYLARAVQRTTLPQEVVSFIALPIEIDGRVAGVLGVHRIRQRQRSLGDDMQVLKTIANLIAQVLILNRLIDERTANLEQENRSLKSALANRETAHEAWGIIGNSPLLLRALRQLEQVAPSDASVLLLGESGTGKELFARALHLQSPRRDGPFLKVNCAAIPEALFESELFGHEKGAFTGASSARAGRFEQADGGTLFIDEVGDLPPAMQVKLLRVLQEHRVERLGSQREIPVDVRIVAATHQDLQALVNAGRFRLDLFYRLNVIPIQLPALRQRPEDIKHLARHFLFQLNQKHQRNTQITPEGMASLATYPWPGNIRQLYNVIERVVLLAEGTEISEEAVDFALVTEAQGQPVETLLASQAAPASAPAAPGQSSIRGYQVVQSDDRRRILTALELSGGNKSRAAQALGLTLRQLNYRIKILGIEYREDKVLTMC